MNAVAGLLEKVAKDVEQSEGSPYHRYVVFAERVFAAMSGEIVKQESDERFDPEALDMIQAILDVAHRTIVRGL